MPKWIRVRDESTGHEFDVSERSMGEGIEGLVPLNHTDYPDLEGPGARPRPARTRVTKNGKAAARINNPADEPADKTQGSES